MPDIDSPEAARYSGASLARSNKRRVRRAPSAEAELYLVSVCHDLKDLLAGLLMNSASLLRALPDDAPDDRAHRLATSIQSSTQRMSRLVNDLHLLGVLEQRRHPLENRPVEVGSLIDRGCDRVAEELRQRAITVDVRMSPEDRAACVIGDERALTDLVGRVIETAAKDAPSSGSLTVDVERGPRWLTLSVVASSVPTAPQPDQPLTTESLGLAVAQRLAIALDTSLSLTPTADSRTRLGVALPLLVR